MANKKSFLSDLSVTASGGINYYLKKKADDRQVNDKREFDERFCKDQKPSSTFFDEQNVLYEEGMSRYVEPIKQLFKEKKYYEALSLSVEYTCWCFRYMEYLARWYHTDYGFKKAVYLYEKDKDFENAKAILISWVSYVKGAQIMDQLKKIQNEEWWDNKSRKYLNKPIRRAVSEYE
ncbi:hypothetical protein DS66_05010 [Mesotoga sp. SC_3PWM13N19]|nr:hypothetical protein DS66_05010 [Mesotoga sp. SC_3PWM13N19]